MSSVKTKTKKTKKTSALVRTASPSEINHLEDTIDNPVEVLTDEDEEESGEKTVPVLKAELTSEGVSMIRDAIKGYAAKVKEGEARKSDLDGLIEKLIAEHEEFQEHKLAQGIVGAYVITYPWMRVGGLYRVREGSQYTVTKAGSLIVVTNITLGSSGTLMPPEKPEVNCLSLDNKGRVANEEQFALAIDDLVPVTEEERKRILAVWAEPIHAHEPLKDGTPVRLKQDVTQIFTHPFFGTKTIFLPQGLAGVVDTPDENEGGSVKNTNKPEFVPPTIEVEFGWNVNLMHNCGASHHLDFNHFEMPLPLAGYGYKYKVYIPEKRGHIEIDQSFIEVRPFNKDALDDVILSDSTRRKLMAAISGSTEDLREWDLEAYSKGKGTIILGVGGPGLGKTMTAESTSEYLAKPLYVVENVMFGNDAVSFEKGLKEINERANRWGAVILWDECEVFLQHSGSDTVQNARIAAVRRAFESFEGIMFLTTNRPAMLDPAVVNRVHTRLFYSPFTEDQKRNVWAKLKPAKMRVENYNEALIELTKLDLNGRDIKTVLRNAAKIASAEGKKIIPGQYLVDEAQELIMASTQLADGKSETELNKYQVKAAPQKNGASDKAARA